MSLLLLVAETINSICTQAEIPLGNKTSWRLSVRCKSQRLRKYVSNETPNDVSVEHLQDVSMVRIHDAPLLHLYYISCNSQMKRPITCGTSPTRLGVMLSRRLVSKSLLRFQVTLWWPPSGRFHVSFKYKIKHQLFLVPPRRETRGI